MMDACERMYFNMYISGFRTTKRRFCSWVLVICVLALLVGNGMAVTSLCGGCGGCFFLTPTETANMCQLDPYSDPGPPCVLPGSTVECTDLGHCLNCSSQFPTNITNLYLPNNNI